MWTRMGLGLSDVGASRRFRRLDGRQDSPVELAEQAPELVHFGAAEVAQRQIEFLHDGQRVAALGIFMPSTLKRAAQILDALNLRLRT
jgi:hypothetical protein